MADRGHAITPGDQLRIGLKDGTAIDMPPTVKPDDMIGGEIGDAGHFAQQIGPSVRQHVGQPFDLRFHEMKITDGSRAHGLDRRRRQAVQAGAVLVQTLGHVIGIDARDIERGGPHELLLGPACQRLVGACSRIWIESGRGHAPLQLSRDQVGVAPDIGAVLQHRRAAIAAGQRRQLGLGPDWRDFHAAPCEAFEPKHQSCLLGKIREVVVVEDEAAHAAFSTPSSAPSGSAFQFRDTTQSGRGLGPSCGLLATVLHET